jgi:hypothetical protein
LQVITDYLIISEELAITATIATLLIKMKIYQNKDFKNLTIEIEGIVYHEEWLPIKDYEELYEISSFGRIKSLKKEWYNGGYKDTTIMYLHKHRKDYIGVKLRNNGLRKGFLVHRLVALHFIPNPENLPEVNHKDFDPSNNMFLNLEWGTRLYNIQYSAKAGRITGWTGEESPRAKHTNESILKIRELYASGQYTQDEIALMFGVKRHNIAKIVLRQRWAHI